MNKVIVNVLQKLEDNGYQAYIVGGYVRDLLLNKESYDVDICTDALPKDVKSIFNIKTDTVNYGSINFRINDYNFDVTTFREEIKYINRRPEKMKYIKDLYMDVLRRDFTINTICLDRNGKLIDLLNGKDDIDNKIIKLIGDNERLKEDPLRILRAIRFSCLLDFDLDPSLSDGIIMYKELLNNLSNTRIKREIDKILISKNYQKGVNLIKKYDLEKYLGIKIPNELVNTNDLCGMWAQIEVLNNEAFTKEERNNIKKIKEIVDIGDIDNYTIYKYGLYISSVTAKILRKDSIESQKIYENLAINSIKDIALSFQEIKEILKKDNESVKKIQEQLEKEIVNNNILNTRECIINYLRQG